MKNKVLYLILARHPQTDDNVNGILSSQRDVPVNAEGITQATLLSSKLGFKDLAAIYSSDLSRAVFLAKRVADYHPGVPLVTDPRLREVNIGRLAGLPRAEAYARFSDSRHRVSHPRFDYSAVGGESKHMVVRRHLQLFRELFAKYAASQAMVAVIGHGGSFQTVLPLLGYAGEVPDQGNFLELAIVKIPSYR